VGSWYCPNEKCGNTKAINRGEKCLDCGTEAQEFGLMAFGKLAVRKKDFQKYGMTKEERKAKEEEKVSSKILFTEETPNEEIRKDILRTLDKTASRESVLGKFLTTLFASTSENAMILFLDTVVKQNEVIIMQNELLYRILASRKDPT